MNALQSVDEREERRTYLGGPAVAAIVGVSPYQAPIDVYRFAVGLDDGPEVNDRMRLGLILEQAIADAYCEQTGRQVRRIGLVRHKRIPFLGGHPDRVIVGEPGLLEMKAAATLRGYTDSEVPAHVRVQVTWYMGLTGRQWCDVAVLAGMQVRPVRVDFDPELYDALEQAAVRFWQEHILPMVEPEPDGTDAYRRHLAEKFPHHVDLELVATPEQALLVEELHAAEQARVAAEVHEKEVENRIRAAMGDAAVLIAPSGRITNRQQAPATRWKEVAEAMANDLMVDPTPFIQRDKAGREGPRVLRRSWPKEGVE